MRISVNRSLLARAAFAPSRHSSSSFHGPTFGCGCEAHSWANLISSERITFRTVFRNTRNSRTIVLIDFP
jgi:hypothetical protein